MKNWSLSKKIWAIIGLLCLAFVGSTAFSLRELMAGRDTLNEITGTLMKRDQLTAEIRDSQRMMSINVLETLRADESRIKEFTGKFETAIEGIKTNLDSYRSAASPEGKILADKYAKDLEAYLPIVKKAQELGQHHKDQEASQVLSTGETLLVALRGYLSEMNKLTAERLAAASADANAAASKAVLLNSITSAISIFLSIMIAFFVLRAVTRAIAEVVKNLSDSSVQVSGAATQIAASSEELSQAATEQAASLEETAASVEQMNSMIAKNSENAKSAEETSGRSQDSVNQGKDIIKKMMASMEAINASSEGMAETVKVIEQIDKKTKVINEIVNKTELLSFNASVEAARAGEHGKGFAVVAEEVGNLARMSGSAAEEIATLLEESIQKVNAMVATTKKNVETGTQVTTECGDVFEQVVQNVDKVSGMATEISSASQEQSRGIDEITKAMSQLDQMTQQNAATSEECASAAEELSVQAEALKNAVSHLVATVNGSDGAGHVFDSTAAAAATSVKKTMAVKPTPTAQQNIVQLKGPRNEAHKTISLSAAAPMKKASGDAPAYDSNGFSDI